LNYDLFAFQYALLHPQMAREQSTAIFITQTVRKVKSIVALCIVALCIVGMLSAGTFLFWVRMCIEDGG
jgi:hypothetical protein